MAQAQILRKGGSIAGPVSLGRIHWAEPVKGTLRVTDGAGNILASLSYSGSGQEPSAITFNPPLQSSTGINITAPGGEIHAYLQGPSGSGY
jgi:hypothetical protein